MDTHKYAITIDADDRIYTFTISVNQLGATISGKLMEGSNPDEPEFIAEFKWSELIKMLPLTEDIKANCWEDICIRLLKYQKDLEGLTYCE